MALAIPLRAGSYKVTAEQLNVRQEPKASSPVINRLSKDLIFEGEPVGKWVKVEDFGIKGYVYGKYVEECQTDTSSSGIYDSIIKIPWSDLVVYGLFLCVAFYVLRFIYRLFTIRGLVIALVGSVLAFILLPSIGEYLLDFVGLGTLGKIIGDILAFGVLCRLFKAAIREVKTSVGLIDYDRDYDVDYPQSSIHKIREQEREYDERRRRQEEERMYYEKLVWEKEEWEYEDRQRREEYERQQEEEMRWENEHEAEYWRRKYEDYCRLAEEANRQAYIFNSYYNDSMSKFIDTGDPTYQSEAYECKYKAESYEEDYERYTREADEAERKYDDCRIRSF